MTGRTTLNNMRVYVDGYDMSGYARNIGPLACAFEEGVIDTLNLTVKQTMVGNGNVSVGTMNGVLDNTATSGILAAMEPKIGTVCEVMVPFGIQAAPVNNDPVFCGQFELMGFQAGPSDNPITVTMPFGNTSARGNSMLYCRPWGVLLHALAAATGANDQPGLDQGAGTTKGGYMMYQVTAAAGTGDKTAAIKVQHSTTTNLDGSFTDLITSGTVNCAAGLSGVVALAPTATVGQYVRWQIALGTASSVTFALAFIRGNL